MGVASFLNVVIGFFIVLAVHIVWAKYRINQWAQSENYTVTKCKICLVNIGPFSYFGTSGGQSVFRLEVINDKGDVKKGYARAGGFFFGLLRKRVEVKWDKSLLVE